MDCSLRTLEEECLIWRMLVLPLLCVAVGLLCAAKEIHIPNDVPVSGTVIISTTGSFYETTKDGERIPQGFQAWPQGHGIKTADWFNVRIGERKDSPSGHGVEINREFVVVRNWLVTDNEWMGIHVFGHHGETPGLPENVDVVCDLETVKTFVRAHLGAKS